MITRKFIHDHPDTIFVFGDNIARKGLGGQAREARGEPNALGLPTKWRPDNRSDSFFTDAEFKKIKPYIDRCFMGILTDFKQRGCEIVFFPRIGMGLADLQNRAPKILAYIQKNIRAIEGKP